MPEAFTLQINEAEDALLGHDTRLVDLLDGLLDCGVVVRGELWLSIADVDLVYLGLQIVLSNPDAIASTGR